MSEPNDLEARKHELFATITLLAGVKRDLVKARGVRRLALIDRQAQLEADKERLSHEVNSQYMYRNLQAFMNRVDAYDAERQKGEKETHSGIAALSGLFQSLAESVAQLEGEVRAQGERLDKSEADRLALHATDKAILKELAEIREYMAATRRGELDQMKQDIASLKARGRDVEPTR